MTNLINKIKIYRNKSPFLFKWTNFILKRRVFDDIISKNKDFCLDGFPRSGNSFLENYISTIDKSLKLSHHTHSIANIKLALKYKKQCFILIRNPLDSICSLVIRDIEIKKNSFKNSVEFSILYYREYYSFLLKNILKIKIIDFEEMIKSPENTIKKIRKYYPLELDKVVNKKTLKEAILKLKKHEKKIKSNFKMSGLPSKRRDKLKKEIRYKIKEDFTPELKTLETIFEKVRNYKI